MMFESSAGEI